MTQEKFEAFGESASAMAAEIVRANLALWPSVLTRGLRRFRPRCGCPRREWAAAASLRNRRWPRGPVPRIVSGAASRVLAKGLAPVHRRTTANAKRLRRTPR